MNNYLQQILFLARNGDAEFWVEILIVVFVAAFWGIGQLIKKAQKPERQGDKPSAPKPTPKPPQHARRPAAPAQLKIPPPLFQPPPRKPVRPHTMPRKHPPRQPPVPIPAPELIEQSKLPELRPQLETEFQELPDFTADAVKKLETLPLAGPSRKRTPRAPVQPLLDYGDPEALRRAILHYEILGKPLSLRHPDENIIGK